MITEGCACGARICSKQNRTFFFRLRRPSKAIRAVVFWWDVRTCWTWCPVVNGEPEDHGQVMGHYDTLQLAFADADAWARGKYGDPR